jgi:hypothetical protein
MKKLLIFSVLIMFKIHTLSAQNLTWEWAKQVNATSISSKADQNGNVYVTGAFDGTLTIGNFTLVDNSTAYAAALDVFVAKYNSAGNVMWAKSFSGNDNDIPKDITVDNNGNCIIFGEYVSQSIAFDNFTVYNFNSSPTSANKDVFITKLDLNGNVLWAKSYGSYYAYDIAISIKSDLNGNCYAMGYANGGYITFGDNPYNYEFYSITSDNVGNLYAAGGFSNTNGKKYVAKWNGTEWGELGGRLSSTFNGIISSIATVAGGTVYAAGSFSNTTGKRYVAKWNGTGWSELGGTNTSTFNNNIRSIAADAAGNVYAAGYFTNTNGKRYVSKWNGTAWSELGGANTSTFNNNILSITTDLSGNVYAAGSFTNTNGKYYVAKWNGSAWSELGGTNSSTFNGGIWSITKDLLGNIYAGGQFSNANGKFYVAKWNGSNWSEVGGTNSSILDINGGLFGIATVAVDATGNVYTAGGFTNLNINNCEYVAKWNGSTWSELGGTNSSTFGNSNNGISTLTIDNGGNVYAAGAFMNTFGKYYVAQWNGSAWGELGGKLRLGQGPFIVKLDNMGSPAFAIKSVGDNKNLTLDNNENIFICGQFNGGPINFGNSVLCCSNGLGQTKMFFAKYNANGNELWARTAGSGDGKDGATAIDIDNTGNIIVAGSYNCSNFYGLPFVSGTVGSFSDNDLFLAKHDSIGNLIWVEGLKSQSPTGGNLKVAGDITTDNNGNYYIAGEFGEGGGGLMYLDTITLSTGMSGNGDLFVAKYNATGKALFAYTAIPGGGGEDAAQDITLDNAGNIYISGRYGVDITVGSSITFGSTTLGIGTNCFVSKLGSSSTVGINTPLTQEEFYNIYPNPLSDFATINFNKNSNYNIKVYDIIGSLIKSYDISGESSLLDMRESSDGVYFVVIEDTNTLKSDVKKIVVNKK